MEQIIIIHWDKSTGPQPIIQYPPQEELPSNDLYLKIWALHELDKKNSMIEYIPEGGGTQYFSILQSYLNENYFMILVYEENAKFENIINEYPDILAIISKNLIELIHTEKIPRAISEAFTTIRNLNIMDEEDILLNFFQDRIKFTILKILRKGVISKSKLTEILRTDYGFSTINIDLILIAFLRENLILVEDAPGVKECYFLINDISCIKIPPKELLEHDDNDAKLDPELINAYRKILAQQFIEQECETKIDNKSVIQLLYDKTISELIKNLRKSPLSVKKCLDILGNRIDLFNELIEDQYIFEMKGRVLLLSDIRFIKFTPLYLFQKLQQRYEKNKISFDELIMHINILANKIQIQPESQYLII